MEKHPELDASIDPFEVATNWQWFKRGLRAWTMMAIVAMIIIFNFGLPHIVTTYRCWPGGPVNLSNAYEATYVGPTGSRVIPADQHGRGCPTIVWLSVWE